MDCIICIHMQHHVIMFYMYHALTYSCIQAIIIHVCITVSTAKYTLVMVISGFQRHLSLIQNSGSLIFNSQLFSKVENSANITYTCKNNCINVLIYLIVLQGLSHFSH